jgi:ATP-dependent Lon protease
MRKRLERGERVVRERFSVDPPSSMIRWRERAQEAATSTAWCLRSSGIDFGGGVLRAQRALAFGIKPPLFDERDIHVHVPEGATPEGRTLRRRRHGHRDRLGDGRLTGAPRPRYDWRDHAARPRVADRRSQLPAALRGSIKTMLIPEENAKDVVEIADSIKSGLEIVPVSRMDEVLARAMTRKPEPIEWDETTTAPAALPEEAPVEEEASTLTAH